MRNYIRRKYFENKHDYPTPVGTHTSQGGPAIRGDGISTTGFEGARNRMRAQILENISQINPTIRHRGIRTTRLEGVGDWILETVEFREWRMFKM